MVKLALQRRAGDLHAPRVIVVHDLDGEIVVDVAPLRPCVDLIVKLLLGVSRMQRVEPRIVDETAPG